MDEDITDSIIFLHCHVTYYVLRGIIIINKFTNSLYIFRFAWIFKKPRKSICILKSYIFIFDEPSGREKGFDIIECTFSIQAE